MRGPFFLITDHLNFVYSHPICYPATMRPSLIIHGGAWDIPDDAVDACKAGCLRALQPAWSARDRKSTRLNSSHVSISYAVFCLKQKNNTPPPPLPNTTQHPLTQPQ